MPPSPANVHALDHVVVVIFENRSFDNLLGRLYTPEERPAFEGVLGKHLSNPVPDWAEHRPPDGVVPYTVADSMDAPDPDPGEEFQHTNTQLFGVVNPANRFRDATEMVPPYNGPSEGQVPTMDGFVSDYISFLTVELGRQPTYNEYRQIMTGFTPEQVPILSGLARQFCVFDHWFSEVPSQTMANRSFWTAATSSGFVVNRPVTNFMRHNRAETIFERLEAHGRSWKIYVLEPDPLSFTGMIHMDRLRDRFHSHFAPFTEFEHDAAAGTLPDFSLIEPNLLAGHCDYHPAFARALVPGVQVMLDPPSSVLAGEAFLDRIYNAVRSADSAAGSNALNTALLVGFDEPGGTYDHVPPGPVPPPEPNLAPGQLGFRFDRSGYRVPAVLVSAWIEPSTLVSEEFRHTSLIATLRKVWDLGAPFTARDGSARTFDHLFDRREPVLPERWPVLAALPVTPFQLEKVEAREVLGTVGRHLCHALVDEFRHEPNQPGGGAPPIEPDVSPRLAVDFAHAIGERLFPSLNRRPATQ